MWTWLNGYIYNPQVVVIFLSMAIKVVTKTQTNKKGLGYNKEQKAFIWTNDCTLGGTDSGSNPIALWRKQRKGL